MKIKTTLPVFIAAMLALTLAECQLESAVEITKAEYVSKNSFIVYYTGDPGSSVSFTAKGKDKQYAVMSSSRITIIDTKVTCKIDGSFVSGDHITVTSYEAPGSAEFDVPDYKE
jgi:hypothetical protein